MSVSAVLLCPTLPTSFLLPAALVQGWGSCILRPSPDVLHNQALQMLVDHRRVSRVRDLEDVIQSPQSLVFLLQAGVLSLIVLDGGMKKRHRLKEKKVLNVLSMSIYEYIVKLTPQMSD